MFQERAAIMEFDGGLTRPAAEAAARSILSRVHTDLRKPNADCVKQTQICADSAQKPRRAAGPGYEAFKAVLRKGAKHGN